MLVNNNHNVEMIYKTLDELVNKDNTNKLAEYLCIDISKLREYLCGDVTIPCIYQKKIIDFFKIDYLVYAPHDVISDMVKRVYTQEAKDAIQLADEISRYILFYRNTVNNGYKLEKEWKI